MRIRESKREKKRESRREKTRVGESKRVRE